MFLVCPRGKGGGVELLIISGGVYPGGYLMRCSTLTVC